MEEDGPNLADLDSDRRRGHELSEDTKRRLIAHRFNKLSYAEISALENVPKSTVASALHRFATRGTVENSSRSGRPKLYNDGDELKIIQTVQLHPQLTFPQLRERTNLSFSKETFKKILKDANVHWKPSRWHLHESRAAKRAKR